MRTQQGHKAIALGESQVQTRRQLCGTLAVEEPGKVVDALVSE
jgi:hypothetical protein